MEPQPPNPEQQPKPGEPATPTPPSASPAGMPPPMPPPVVPPAPPVPSAWGPPAQAPANWPQASAGNWPQAPAGYPGQAMPPSTVVVTRAPVTTLAKIGAAFLVVIGTIIGLFGLLLVVLGFAGRGIFENVDPSAYEGSGLTADQVASLAGTFIVFGGAIVVVIGVLQLLAGIGSWRGAGIARVTGIIFAVLFGLFALAGATGSGARGAANGGAGGGGIVSWVVAIGYIYTAAVLIFAWKEKAPR